MITCIAVDDEPLALELLEDNISKLPFLKRVASCDNALEAMKVMSEQDIDLIFLDIQMPGMTGLQFIESMTVKPMIILITAYEKHALEAFGLDVVDYLVKPVSLDRFIKACNKAKELHALKQHQKVPGHSSPPDYFFVNVDYSLLKVSFSDITHIEGLKDYIKIFLKNSTKPIITRMNMKSLEDLLPAPRFIRIHKSFIISVDAITAVRKNSVFIGAIELPVSESYPDALGIIMGKH